MKFSTSSPQQAFSCPGALTWQRTEFLAPCDGLVLLMPYYSSVKSQSLEIKANECKKETLAILPFLPDILAVSCSLKPLHFLNSFLMPHPTQVGLSLCLFVLMRFQLSLKTQAHKPRAFLEAVQRDATQQQAVATS